MLKFLPGLVLLQVISISLVLLAPQPWTQWVWAQLLIPLISITVLIAFWFKSLAIQMSKDEVSKLKEKHAGEREKLKVNAERAKHKITKDTQKYVEQEVRKTSAKANFKVGAAVAGVVGVGGLLVLSQFMALGVMMLATAGGTVGGYVLRIRHEHSKQHKLQQSSDTATPVVITTDKTNTTRQLGHNK